MLRILALVVLATIVSGTARRQSDVAAGVAAATASSAMAGAATANCNNCTAFVTVQIEDPTAVPPVYVAYWGGCPSSTCSVGSCQQDSNEGYSRAWCECPNNCYGDCKAEVVLNGDEEITGWSCTNTGCAGACWVEPFPITVEGNWYPCVC